MVTHLMTHPAIAKTYCHVQHGHNTIHQPLAFIIQKSKTRIRDNPKVVGLHQFLEDYLVIIFICTDARCLQPALVTAHAMYNLHVRGINNLHLFVFNQSRYLFGIVFT